MSLCSNCDGEGKLHQPNCAVNETGDSEDCACRPQRCQFCRGQGIKLKKKSPVKKGRSSRDENDGG